MMYRIRNKDTGLFSTGGMTPSWSKRGKVWAQRGHVTSHLTQLDRTGRERYKNAEIVTYEMNEIDILPVQDWKELPSTTRAKELEHKRHIEWQREQLQRKEEKLRKELEAINAKLGKANGEPPRS